MSKAKNDPLPEVDINLPPGVLEVAAKEANIQLSQDDFKTLHSASVSSFQDYINSEKGQRDMEAFQLKYNTQPTFNFAVTYMPQTLA